MGAVPDSLSQLPNDLFHLVACSLDVEDYMNLSMITKRHHRFLKEEKTSWQALQRSILYNKDGQEVKDAHEAQEVKAAQEVKDNLIAEHKSWQAMNKVFRIRQSIASARPYSASLLAYGDVFIYREGFLCYVDGPCVRVLNVHSVSRTEEVIDVGKINTRPDVRPLKYSSGSVNEIQIISLSYAEGVLVCLYKTMSEEEYWLVVIDLGQPQPGTTSTRRKPFRHHLESTARFFVRHNRSYLYYGTHNGLRSDHHREWLLTGIDLKADPPQRPQPLRLANFVGSHIGSTACFEIHDGFFYAVSNQTSFTAEEVDWTSYYHCIRIPLGDPTPDLQSRPIWQRQHMEGPINDSWTDLSLQKDEQSNQLLIVECRKEWLGGSTVNLRTYYIQPIYLDSKEGDVRVVDFPADDPLILTLDDQSKPHFSEPQRRIRKNVHCEYEKSRHDPDSVTTSHDFILAKTKFRGYNVPAMSFLDLVSDRESIPGSARSRDRLRLRVASRRKKSPLIVDPQKPDHFLIRQPELDEDGVPLEGSEDDFYPTEVHFWPPDDAPAEIYDVLCPGGQIGNVKAIADERSIMYVISDRGTPTRSSRIVMISFDPTWGHQGLKKLAIPTTTGHSAKKQMQKEPENDLPMLNTTSSTFQIPSGPIPTRVAPTSSQTWRHIPATSGYGAEEQIKKNPEIDLPTLNATGPASQAPSGPIPSRNAPISPQTQGHKRSRSNASDQDSDKVIWTEKAKYLRINKGYSLG